MNIQKISKFKEIVLPKDLSQTLILLDMDLTVLNWPAILKQSILNESFFQRRLQHWLAQGKSETEIYQTLHQWAELLLKFDPSPSEPELPQILEQWQDRGALVIGLTARPGSDGIWDQLRHRLIEQLHALNIALGKGLDFNLSLQDLKKGACFRNGLIFANFFDKGKMARAFLQRSGLIERWEQPLLIFVDDQIRHCHTLIEAFEGTSIAVKTFHYQGIPVPSQMEASDDLLEERILELWTKFYRHRKNL